MPLFSAPQPPLQTFLEMRRFEYDGNGAFVDLGPAAAPGARMGSALALDLDGDGDLDVVDENGIWWNNGSQAFSLAAWPFTGWRPVAHGDVDGDGDQDFLAVATNHCGLAILLQTAPGTFQLTVLSPPQVLTAAFDEALLVDIDLDGDLDVVGATSPNSGDVTIFLNQGGAFVPGPTVTLPPGLLSVADVDQDGLPDLVASDDLRLTVRRRSNSGPLAFDAPVAFATPRVYGFADLDGDGDPDGIGASVMNRHFDGPLAGMRRQYGSAAAGAGGRSRYSGPPDLSARVRHPCCVCASLPAVRSRCWHAAPRRPNDAR